MTGESVVKVTNRDRRELSSRLFDTARRLITTDADKFLHFLLIVTTQGRCGPTRSLLFLR
jgi:hypothetical protein